MGLMENFLTILGIFLAFFLSVLSGVFGWLAVNWFIQPWLKFLEVRQSIYETLIFYSNIHSNMTSEEGDQKENEYLIERWKKGNEEYRKLHCKLDAVYTTMFVWLKLYAVMRGYDAKEASSKLIGLHNSQGRRSVVNEQEIRRALKLPRQIPDKELARMRALYFD